MLYICYYLLYFGMKMIAIDYNNSEGFLIGRGMSSMYLIKIVKLNESAVKLSEKLD